MEIVSLLTEVLKEMLLVLVISIQLGCKFFVAANPVHVYFFVSYHSLGHGPSMALLNFYMQLENLNQN